MFYIILYLLIIKYLTYKINLEFHKMQQYIIKNKNYENSILLTNMYVKYTLTYQYGLIIMVQTVVCST